jgi:hypothetical protein
MFNIIFYLTISRILLFGKKFKNDNLCGILKFRILEFEILGFGILYVSGRAQFGIL